MKSLKKLLYPAILIGGIGILAYLGLVAKTMDTTMMFLLMGMVVLLTLNMYVGSLSQAQRGGTNKTTYREAYAEFIGDSFLDNKQLEQKLYVALENMGRKKFSAAIKRLDELMPLCRNDDERFTVLVFKGMSYNYDNCPAQAAESYEAALAIKENSTVYSNLGMALSKMNDEDAAEEAYLNAIRLDDQNAYALNNLAQLYIHQEDYENALIYANCAFQTNDRLLQAINALTICHGVLGNEEEFETFYGLSVKLGANGPSLKQYINDLKVKKDQDQ